MHELRKSSLMLSLGVSLLILTGFTPNGYLTSEARSGAQAITHHVALLRSSNPQEKAAAAYWLGQQRSAAAKAVDPLIELLGDSTQVDPARYRSKTALQKMTVGEEAAAALVNIGRASIEPLIHVLKNSPEPEARKNAAWALGALHDTGATQI